MFDGKTRYLLGKLTIYKWQKITIFDGKKILPKLSKHPSILELFGAKVPPPSASSWAPPSADTRTGNWCAPPSASGPAG